MRRGAVWIGVIVLTLAALILAIPQLLSTRIGTRAILTLVNQRIAGSVDAKQIRLTWLGMQRVDEFVLRGADGTPIFTAKQITTDAALWTLIFGGQNYGKNELIDPKLQLTIDKQGRSNLAKALAVWTAGDVTLAYMSAGVVPSLGSAGCKNLSLKEELIALSYGRRLQAKGLVTSAPREGAIPVNMYALAGPPSFSIKWKIPKGELLIENAEIEIRSPLAPPATFSNLNGLITNDQTLSVDINGPFLIEAKGTTAKVENFPVILIDAGLSFVQPKLVGLAGEIFGDRLSLTMQEGELDLSSPKLAIKGSETKFVVKGDVINGEFSLDPLSVNVAFQTELLHHFTNWPVVDLLGPTLAIKIDKDRSKIAIQAKGEAFHTPPIYFELNDTLKLKSEVTFAYHLSPNLSPYLSKKTKLIMQISRFEMPWKLNVMPKEITAIAEVKSDNVYLIDVPEQGTLILEDFRLGILEGTLANAIWGAESELVFPDKTTAAARWLGSGAPVRMDGKLRLTSNWKLDEILANVLIPARYLNVQFIASYSGDGKLHLLSPLNISYFVQQDELLAQPFEVQLIVDPVKTLTFRDLQLTGVATVSDIRFKGEEESSITDLRGSVKIDVPNDRAEIIFSGNSYTKSDQKAGKIEGSAIITDFQDGGKLQGKATIGPIPSVVLETLWGYQGLPDLLGSNVSLNTTFDFSSLMPAKGNVDIQLTSQNAEGKASLDIDQGIQLSFNFKDKSSKGNIDLRGQYVKHTFDLKWNASELSMPWAAVLLGFGKEKTNLLTAFFGSNVNVTGSIALTKKGGPLSLQIQSDNATASFEGTLTGHHLALRKALTAQAKVTPELGKAVLEFVNPLFVTAVRSDNPITLNVEPQGFSLSLFPLDPASLQVEKATVDLGKIWIKNRGLVKSLLKLFGQTGSNEIRTWSTPLYLSVKDGVAHYNRMDTLIGKNLQVASWGTINLSTKRIHLNLGIPIDSTYLIIPLKGTLPNIKVNWKKTAGKLAGTTLLGTGTQKVPPPTTQPFPWDVNP